jgi:large subunit ribosomal protein L22
MEVVATAKWVHTTARKARLVTHMVEGLPVAEALVVLRYSPRAAARDVAKVIQSAAANAEHNYNLDASTLRVIRIEVDGADVFKRWRAKPRGMVGSIFKRTSHLRAFVTDEEPAPNTRRRSVVRLPRAAVPAPIVAPTKAAGASSIRRRRTVAAVPTASAAEDTVAQEPEGQGEAASVETSAPKRPRAPRRRKSGDAKGDKE